MSPAAGAHWITDVWAVLLALAVLAYVLLDGFDLGVGILFVVEHRAEERDLMVNSIAPVWDGNETWLVMGGGGLFAVFPLAYAVLLPAFYPTLIGMLLALILRGVAFEFRFRARSWGRFWWDVAFCAGSLMAALCQGLTLGGLLQGVKVVNNAYAGGWWDWLTPFTVGCGLAVVVGYALLGACWLIWRTEGGLQALNRRYARVLAILTLCAIGGVSLWTPFLNARFMHRWFHWPGIALTSPVPLLVALAGWVMWRALGREDSHATPLLCAYAWFVLCFAGLGISFFPLIVPPDITLWQAASPASSEIFLLVGAAVMFPVILGYTCYSYWIFRGKVRADAGYH
jgi:cytochrome d ubiquinol oxidase subunit II